MCVLNLCLSLLCVCVCVCVCWCVVATSPNAGSELEQARPQTSGEEELQLQLALAMSREAAEQVHAQRHTTHHTHHTTHTPRTYVANAHTYTCKSVFARTQADALVALRAGYMVPHLCCGGFLDRRHRGGRGIPQQYSRLSELKLWKQLRVIFLLKVHLYLHPNRNVTENN